MKTLAWLDFLAEQRAKHRKLVFSVAELANAARTTPHALNTELGRLLERGVLTRYSHGLYGSAEGVAAEDIVPAIDSGAYITGFYALFRRHLVTQVPVEVTCFTNRRHNRRPDRAYPMGKLRFVCVPPCLYAKPRDRVIAPAEQALSDLAWLSVREGLEPQSLLTFRNLQTLNHRRLRQVLRRYPGPVARLVTRLLGCNH